MSSNNFAPYVTGVAFCLMLTKPQIKGLTYLSMPSGSMDSLRFLVCGRVTQALMYKGLVENGDKGLELTAPGKLVVELLKLAGLIELGSKKQFVTNSLIREINEEISQGIPEHSRKEK